MMPELRLLKMGRAMTIKVAMADAIGEESDTEEAENQAVLLRALAALAPKKGPLRP